MTPGLTQNKDFLAGLLMLVVGGIGFAMAMDYPFGSSLRMGPGYFPRALSVILAGFGIYVMIRGVLQNQPVKGRWGWKPLAFIVVSLLVFGVTMEHLGFIPALVAMFLLSAFGGHEFKLTEVLVLTAIMTTFAVGVFVYALGLPYPLLQGF